MRSFNADNTNVKGETTMKNTAKARRTNNKFIASICAVIAATAMVTGIAVFSASASEISSAPAKPAVTAAAQVKAPVAAEVKTEEKAAVKAEDTVNENGKHPGESGYGYTDEESAQPRMLGFNFEAVKRNYELYEQQQAAGKQEAKQAEAKTAEPEQSEVKKDVQQAAAEKQPGEAGFNYVNESGKHPGESGYGYNEKKQGTLFPSGIYNDVNGTNASLEIATYDGITCYCTVTLPNGIGRQVIYGFMGTANGSTMEYTGATKNDRTIDENGAIINTTLIEKNHYGTVNRTEKGLVWQDIDGNSYVFAV